MYMNKYDEIYNYENLNAKDKRFIDGYREAVENAENKFHIVEDIMEVSDLASDTLSNIKREIAEETINAVLNYLKIMERDLIIGFIDASTVEEENVEN